MSLEQAIRIIDEALSKIPTGRDTHSVFMSALEVIKTALRSLEQK